MIEPENSVGVWQALQNNKHLLEIIIILIYNDYLSQGTVKIAVTSETA